MSRAESVGVLGRLGYEGRGLRDGLNRVAHRDGALVGDRRVLREELGGLAVAQHCLLQIPDFQRYLGSGGAVERWSVVFFCFGMRYLGDALPGLAVFRGQLDRHHVELQGLRLPSQGEGQAWAVK